MLLDVADARTLTDVEAVNTAVLAALVSAVVNAAACNDGHVTIFADMEIVIHQLLDTCLRHYHGDVHTLVLRVGCDINIDTGKIFLLFNGNMLRGILAVELTVDTQGVRTLGYRVQVCHLTKQFYLNGVKSLLLRHWSRPPFPVPRSAF